MQLQGTRASARAGASACAKARCAPLRPTSLARRTVKPVCFKEKDDIEDATARPTAPYTPTSAASAYDPLMTPGALRPVHLGPVGASMYPVLQYGTLVAVLAATVAPSFTVRTVLQAAATPTSSLLVIAAGAALIPSMVAKHQIKVAADNGLLAAPVFKQMVNACLLNGVLALVVLSQAVSLRNPVLAATVGSLSGLATITTAYTLMKIRETGQLMPSGRGVLGGLLNLLTPASATSAAYSLITAALLAMGTTLFTTDPFTPSMMFYAQKDAVHVFASRIAGAATLANGLLAFVVKEAADQGRQGSPVFRSLNGALAVALGVTAIVKAYALATNLAMSNNYTMGVVGVMAAAAAFCGYQFAAAPGGRSTVTAA